MFLHPKSSKLTNKNANTFIYSLSIVLFLNFIFHSFLFYRNLYMLNHDGWQSDDEDSVVN